MMRFLLVASFAILSLVFVRPAPALEVTEAVMTTGVVDREPVDQVEVFPSHGGKLYCFTRITGATEPTTVVHLWYHDDDLVSRVELPVRSPDWRTWSVKGFTTASGAGLWRVEIEDANGRVLRQIGFRLL